ncbi:MAG TPA: hypothetical protein VNO84_16165 [Burkholderiaceae bacterium]|nr:hypothetical protein [Burkholderiaceae bacterium]
MSASMRCIALPRRTYRLAAASRGRFTAALARQKAGLRQYTMEP